MSRKPSDGSGELLDGGGNIDIDALFRAYEEQSDDDSPVEVTFELQRNHNKRLDAYLAGRIPFLSRTRFTESKVSPWDLWIVSA